MSPDPIFRFACLALFVYGLVLSLPGTLLALPDVVDRLGLTLADRGVVIAALFGGLFAGSLLSARFVDVLGHRRALAGSAVLVALCLPLLTLAGSARTLAVALALLGLAAAGMNTAGNALSSDLFPAERARRLNGIALAFSLGGLTMPLLTTIVPGPAPWRAVVFGGAVIAAVVAAAVPQQQGEGGRGKGDKAGDTVFVFFTQPGLVMFGALVLLGAGTEASMAGWTSTYLVGAGFSSDVATRILSLHWLGLVVGRLLFSGRVDRDKRFAVVAAALTSVAGSVVLVLGDGSVLGVMPFVLGVTIAVIVPTILALAGERLSGGAGTVFGMLLTLAQVGGIALPSAIGVIAERAGLRAGLSLLVMSNLAVAVLAMRLRGRAHM